MLVGSYITWKLKSIRKIDQILTCDVDVSNFQQVYFSVAKLNWILCINWIERIEKLAMNSIFTTSIRAEYRKKFTNNMESQLLNLASIFISWTRVLFSNFSLAASCMRDFEILQKAFSLSEQHFFRCKSLFIFSTPVRHCLVSRWDVQSIQQLKSKLAFSAAQQVKKVKSAAQEKTKENNKSITFRLNEESWWMQEMFVVLWWWKSFWLFHIPLECFALLSEAKLMLKLKVDGIPPRGTVLIFSPRYCFFHLTQLLTTT